MMETVRYDFSANSVHLKGFSGPPNGAGDGGDLGAVHAAVQAHPGARLRDILGGGQLLRAHARHDVLQLADIQGGAK